MSEDALKVERWVGEGIIKCAHIVLSSRIYRCSRTLPPRSRSNWFKLEVEEVEDAVRPLERYRKDVSRPLVIEIFLESWRGKSQSSQEGNKEELLERWELQFDGIPPTQQPSNYSSYDDMPTLIYKRMVVMVRSLYSYVRVLPAYRLYRACREQRAAPFNITYKLSDSLDKSVAHAVESGMHQFERFALTPIETLTGNLNIAVEYRSQHHVATLHAATQTASIPQHIIPDYIRSDGHSAPRVMQKTLSASAYPAAASPLPSTGGGGPADVIVGAGFSMFSRAYSAARASSARLFAPARLVGSPHSSNPTAWLQTAPAWHQRQGSDWPNFETSPSRPNSASKPPLPGTSPTNTLRMPSAQITPRGEPGASPSARPELFTAPEPYPAASVPPNQGTTPIHIAQPRAGAHARPPAGISFMPSSAPELALAHQDSGSPYSLHMRGQVRHNASHRNLTEITTVGFRADERAIEAAAAARGAIVRVPHAPRGALYGALQDVVAAHGDSRARRAGPADSSRHSVGSSASNMSCSSAVRTTALVSRKPSTSSQLSVEIAGMSLDRRSLTVMMESGDSRRFSPHQHACELPIPWHADENAMYGPLRLEHPSCSGNISPQGGPGLCAESSEDAKNASSLQQEDSLEGAAMFPFDIEASSRPALARNKPATSAPTEARNSQPGSYGRQGSSSRNTVGSAERVGWQDMTASAPVITHQQRTAATCEQDIKDFINMLCKADEFTTGDNGQESVVSVQAELLQLSAKWSECIY